MPVCLLCPLLDCCVANAGFQRPRVVVSCGSSRVSKALHVSLMNRRTVWPSVNVVASKNAKVSDVCKRSLAYACQAARSKSKSKIQLLCGSARRFSKTGMAHYQVTKLHVHTC